MTLFRRLVVAPPETPTPPIILADGTELAVTIRRSTRAQRIALKLHPAQDGVELVVPAHVSVKRARDFLDSKIDWITHQFQSIPPRILFSDGTIIPVLGKPRRLTNIAGRDRSRFPFVVTDDTIEVTGRPEHVSRRTIAGLRELAGNILGGKTRIAAEKISRPLGKISIGDAQTRWGSCNRTGNIKYSWRLIMTPETVIDYVVAHEVAHLIEMNHSVRFWRLVKQLHPNFEQDRAWLRLHAAELHRYG